jgi:endonuclease/exonuclease/phosphatase (EEP) superfamily protein YafD
VHGHDILLLNTHLDYRQEEAERLAGVAEFKRILEENDRGARHPVIFTGDFNAIPGSDTYNRMHELLVDVWPIAGQGPGATIPVKNPQRRIDYIWISKDAPFKPVRAWVPRTEASDHLPVVAEFSVSPRRQRPE